MARVDLGSKIEHEEFRKGFQAELDDIHEQFEGCRPSEETQRAEQWAMLVAIGVKIAFQLEDVKELLDR